MRDVLRISNLVLLLVCVACSVNSSTHSAVLEPTTTKSPPADLSHTPESTLTLRPTTVPKLTLTLSSLAPATTPHPTSTPLPDTVWVEGIDRFSIGYYAGLWSPIANELLLENCTQRTSVRNEERVILRADAPDFGPIDVTPDDFACFDKLFDMIWSPDGQHIVFNNPPDTTSVQAAEYSDVWSMLRDGSNAYIVNPGESWYSRYLHFLGWMNYQTVVSSSYAGGGYWNIRGVKIETIQDEKHPSKDTAEGLFTTDYIAETVQMLPFYARAISNNTQDTRSFPTDSLATELDVSTSFRDWLPGTNKMLVKVEEFKYKGDDTHLRDESYPSSFQLVLWDVDTDAVTPLVSDGRCGQFSPDGFVLAYLDGQRHLRLLDLTREIKLSLPIFNCHYGCDLFIAFSPHSRYLAFFTPAPIKLDDERKPIGVDHDSDHVYLNVLDVSTGQIVHSATAANISTSELCYPGGRRGEHYWYPGFTMMWPTWSPDDARLVYRDADLNPVMLDLSSGNLVPLTKSGGARVSNPQWSFDSHYLSLDVYDDTGDSQIVVIEVP